MVLEIEITEKGLVLESRFQTSDRAYLARLTGKDPNYTFTREFLNGTNQGAMVHPVQPGDILEVSETHWSGNWTTHSYYKVNAAAQHPEKINFEEVTRSFL